MSTPTPKRRVPTDPLSSYRAIENLIATYAELVDDGDFAGVAILLADANFTGSAGSVSGRDAIETMLRDTLIVYDDGTPRTIHQKTWGSFTPGASRAVTLMPWPKGTLYVL